MSQADIEKYLKKNGESTVTDIHEELKINRPNITSALNKMLKQRVVYRKDYGYDGYRRVIKWRLAED